MTNNKLFPLGQVVITPNAMTRIPKNEVLHALSRHKSGDFGDLTEADKQTNLEALEHGGDSILSAYNSTSGERFFIITERDRSATTILLAWEY